MQFNASAAEFVPGAVNLSEEVDEWRQIVSFCPSPVDDGSPCMILHT